VDRSWRVGLLVLKILVFGHLFLHSFKEKGGVDGYYPSRRFSFIVLYTKELDCWWLLYKTFFILKSFSQALALAQDHFQAIKARHREQNSPGRRAKYMRQEAKKRRQSYP
jgi:hypothetical protein